MPKSTDNSPSISAEATSAEAAIALAIRHSGTAHYVVTGDDGHSQRLLSENFKDISGHEMPDGIATADFWHRHIHPEDLPMYRQARANLSPDQPTSIEYRFRQPDGAYLRLADECRRLIDPADGQEKIVGSLRDNTRRAKADQMARDAVEAIPFGFTVSDSDDRYVLCNSTLLARSGMRPDDIIGMQRIELWRKVCEGLRSFDGETMVDVDAWAEKIVRRLREPPDDPIEFQHANGDWRMISRSTTPDGGQVTIITDISKIKETEAALRKSEEHFRRIVEDHPLPVNFVDFETGELLYASPAAVAMFGYEWPSPESRFAVDHYVDPKDREDLIKKLAATGDVQGHEVRTKRIDGTVFWVRLNSRLMDLEGRRVVVSIFADVSEAKRRETQFRKTQELLEDAIESLSEGFALFDHDDQLVMCNSQYRDFHKISSDIIKPGMTWVDLMRSDLAQGLFIDAVGHEDEWLNERIKARTAVKRDMEYEQSDGRWIVGSNTRTRDGSIVVTLRDITSRKRRETETIEARQMLEDAIESLPEGFVIWDKNDEFVMCNQRYRNINKISEAALKPGVTWREFVRAGAELGQYAEAIGRVDEWYEKRVQTRQIGNVAEYQLADGRWVMTSSHATRLGGRVATRLDVTERRNMEEALRESEAMIRRILEACPVPVAMNRPDGEYIYASPANESLFGYDSSEGYANARGRYADPRVRDNYIDQLLRDRQVDGYVAEYNRIDGSTFWGAVSARLIDYQGEDVIVSTILDLTERYAVEAEMEHQREALYQSEKLNALGTLLAGVAHELNNPLSVVSGQALLLEETTVDTRIRERAVMIGDAAERCARIVKTFLAMAREEPGETTAVDLSAVVDTALEVTGYALRTTDIHLTKRLSKSLALVLGSPDQLNQVITNLIVNAQQALEGIKPPRRLTITTRQDRKRRQSIIRITDNGPGIPEENRRRVYEPFFTTKPVGEGTGIGLAVCHQIIEAHRGSIDIEAPRRGGTSFVIRLPWVTGMAPTAGRQRPPQIRPCRVLVVDDEPNVARLVSDILTTDGHTAVIANSVKRAMSILERDTFHMIVSDLRLPDSDGFGVFDALQNSHPELLARTAFMTGDTMNVKTRAFLETAGLPYLEKPITPDDLRDLVYRTIVSVRSDGTTGEKS